MSVPKIFAVFVRKEKITPFFLRHFRIKNIKIELKKKATKNVTIKSLPASFKRNWYPKREKQALVKKKRIVPI